MPLALILTTLMQSLEDDEYIAQKLCILLCLDKCRQIKSHNEVVSFHLFFKLIYSLKGRYFSGILSNLYDSVIFLWNLSRPLLEGNGTQLRVITNFSETQGGGGSFHLYCSFTNFLFQKPFGTSLHGKLQRSAWWGRRSRGSTPMCEATLWETVCVLWPPAAALLSDS